MIEYVVELVAGESVELVIVEAASEAEARTTAQDLVDMFYPLDEGWTTADVWEYGVDDGNGMQVGSP